MPGIATPTLERSGLLARWRRGVEDGSLRARRDAAGMTLPELAAQVGTSDRTLSLWERGRQTPADTDHLRSWLGLLDALPVDTDPLVVRARQRARDGSGRALRLGAGLSLQQVARHVGRSGLVVHNWEHGRGLLQHRDALAAWLTLLDQLEADPTVVPEGLWGSEQRRVVVPPELAQAKVDRRRMHRAPPAPMDPTRLEHLQQRVRAMVADGSARRAREAARVSRRALADKLGVVQITLLHWEKGHKEPSDPWIAAAWVDLVDHPEQMAALATPFPAVRRVHVPPPELAAARAPLAGLDLRGIREAAGVSQGEAARRLGVSQPALANWERGVCLPATVPLTRRYVALVHQFQRHGEGGAQTQSA